MIETEGFDALTRPFFEGVLADMNKDRLATWFRPPRSQSIDMEATQACGLRGAVSNGCLCRPESVCVEVGEEERKRVRYAVRSSRQNGQIAFIVR